MRTILLAGCALLGIYLSMRSIAALYRILDLWYTIGTAYLLVIRGLLIWLGATAIVAFALRDSYRDVFLIAVVGYVVFYVAAFLLANAAVRRIVANNLDASSGGASAPPVGRP